MARSINNKDQLGASAQMTGNSIYIYYGLHNFLDIGNAMVIKIFDQIVYFLVNCKQKCALICLDRLNENKYNTEVGSMAKRWAIATA